MPTIDTTARIAQRLEELRQVRQAFSGLHLHAKCLRGTLRMKDRLPFTCSTCGAGKDGEWLMQPHNVFLGNGCPCCESVARVQARFASASYLEGYRLQALSSPSGKADVNSLRYTVISPDGLRSSPLMRSAVVAAIRLGRIPGCAEIVAQREIKELVGKFELVFNSGGKIAFAGGRKDATTTPGPFFNLSTGSRIMREPLINLTLPVRGVNGLIEREIKDRQNHEAWSNEAADYRAAILGYVHTTGTQVKIRYQSRTGFKKEHTLQRARETNWGQSGYKKGEKLCQAILLELFPEADWKWNNRYEFLQYESSLLELDGYSPGLNLAFEHQGAQHYDSNNAFDATPEEFEERVRRDEFKVEKCKREAIKLLIVPPLLLDPALYLHFIQAELAKLGIAPSCEPALEQVSKRWRELCKNPLQRFQASVVYGLGTHSLISPELELVTVATVITYRCGSCMETNLAEAKGFSAGEPRRYCPQCKGKASGKVRRAASLARWKESLTEPVFARLVARPGERLALVCEQGHEEIVSTVSDVQALHDNDTYLCPHCETKEMGFEDSSRSSRLSAAVLTQRRSEFETKIRDAGLMLVDRVFMRNDGELGEVCAAVSCPEGHHFELGLTELSRLLSNKYLSDRSVVPHLCELCCYPGTTPDSRKSTVFHRLDFLKRYHPRARYVGGFDPTGKAMEEYHCGEQFKTSGKPHPNFLVRYRTIRTPEKAALFRTPCYVCAVEKGEGLPSSSKTIEMIEGRMLLISEAVAAHSGGALPIPAVALAAGEQLIEGKYISTSKTRLLLSCGVASHPPATRTADSYFSVHKAGYCKICLGVVGLKDVSGLLHP